MKVSELTGAELDFWAAKAEGKAVLILNNECFLGIWHSPQGDVGLCSYSPSSDWSQGGPIIEREAGTFGIESNDQNFEHVSYWAEMGRTITRYRMSGPTHLIAAMRARIASKFGEEVDDSQAQRI